MNMAFCSLRLIMKKLRELRTARGLSLKELGHVIGVAESTMSLYETGKRQPDYKNLKSLADYFDVTIDSLLDREYPSESKGIKIPVLGRVQAGIPVEAVEDIIDFEEITPEMASLGDLFALIVKGDSMEPRIKEGDIVIVRKQPDLESGEIGVILINGNDATVKKILKYEQGISLVPFNPAYSPHFYPNSEIENLPVTIIGRVIELRGKF
ncbi:MAG: XRE family transcriptional regulator [Clostridiales bacterium]|nr:XRE family transcriptional regulator [Clostridiales bacterium]